MAIERKGSRGVISGARQRLRLGNFFTAAVSIGGVAATRPIEAEVRQQSEPVPEEVIMSTAQSKPTGPDLARGISADDLLDGGMLAGHVGEEAVLLACRGNDFFAIGATCSHYGGPLAEGLMVEDTVRCPWHHACFSLRTGEALRAPALNPVSCWRVEQRDGTVYVREKIESPGRPLRRVTARLPQSVVIV